MKTLQRLFIVITLGLVYITAQAQEKKHLEVGDTMPEFALPDQSGKLFSSANEVGKHVLIIYFYPKDESMVCTKEACEFRDSFKDFTDAGAKVIGINGGTVESHKAFADNEKLPFTLLSDPGNKVLARFGVKGALFMTGRETFIIGLDGKVKFEYRSMMQGKEHAQQALAFVKAAKK